PRKASQSSACHLTAIFGLVVLSPLENSSYRTAPVTSRVSKIGTRTSPNRAKTSCLVSELEPEPKKISGPEGAPQIGVPSSMESTQGLTLLLNRSPATLVSRL